MILPATLRFFVPFYFLMDYFNQYSFHIEKKV